jgi:hypothetical protein
LSRHNHRAASAALFIASCAPKAGIGAVSNAEIKRAITQGIAPDGHKMKPPMAYAWYARLTDSDVDALVA